VNEKTTNNSSNITCGSKKKTNLNVLREREWEGGGGEESRGGEREKEEKVDRKKKKLSSTGFFYICWTKKNLYIFI
jgi:hypothetical protein